MCFVGSGIWVAATLLVDGLVLVEWFAVWLLGNCCGLRVGVYYLFNCALWFGLIGPACLGLGFGGWVCCC